jgi:hypothetical protein
METEENYIMIGERNNWFIFSISGLLMLGLGVFTISLYSYNPVAISISSSVGAWGVVLIMTIYSKLTNKNFKMCNMNPLASGILVTLFQVASILSYYYDPGDAGTTTVVISIFIITLKYPSRTLITCIGIIAIAAGLVVLVYIDYITWTLTSFAYSTLALVFFRAIKIFNKSEGKIENLLIISSINTLINILIIGFLMILGLSPFNYELELMVFGFIAGGLISSAWIIFMVFDIKEQGVILCGSIGSIHTISEWIYAEIHLQTLKFIPVIIISTGIELILISRYIQEKTIKIN